MLYLVTVLLALGSTTQSVCLDCRRTDFCSQTCALSYLGETFQLSKLLFLLTQTNNHSLLCFPCKGKTAFRASVLGKVRQFLGQWLQSYTMQYLMFWKEQGNGKTCRYVQALASAYFYVIIKLHPRLEPGAYKHRGSLHWRFYVIVKGWKEGSIIFLFYTWELRHRGYYALLEVIQEVCGRAKNWTEISRNRKSGLPLSAAGFVLLVMWAELAPSILLPVLSISVFPVWACFSSET